MTAVARKPIINIKLNDNDAIRKKAFKLL